MSYRTKQRLWKLLIHLVMIAIVAACLFPVLWSCVISIKTVGEKVSGFHALRITQPTLANYERLFELIPLWRHLGNSVFTSVVGTLTTLVFCSLAGFAFAKYRFPGRNALFYFVVATMTIPAEVGAVPWETDFYNATAGGRAGAGGFEVASVSLEAAKSLKITDSYSLPLFARVIWNPATEGAYFVFGVSL